MGMTGAVPISTRLGMRHLSGASTVRLSTASASLSIEGPEAVLDLLALVRYACGLGEAEGR